MSFSDFKVGKRLAIGFGLTLAFFLCVGAISWMRLAHLNQVVTRATQEDWQKARLTMEMQIRSRDNASKAARIFLSGDDVAAIDALKSEMSANSEQNEDALGQLEKLLTTSEDKALLDEAAAAREKYNAARSRAGDLAKDPRTRAQGLELYRGEVAALFEKYQTPFIRLMESQRARFVASAEESAATYRNGRNILIATNLAALILVTLFAIALTRSIVRPLRNAVQVAESVRDGRLDNVIEVDGTDEAAQLLGSLDSMQHALRARDEKDADYRGQIAAIDRSQAVIEFDMNGTVREINENFARVMGFARAEVVGKHHSMFVEPAHAASADYRAFWDRLNRGQSEVGTFKRVAKGGREVWLSASYNPIPDASGKPFKVVKYANDMTEQMVRNADNQGQLAAISRSQAVIEFEMDGTVRRINENFARTMGYTSAEVVGKHHSLFADAATVGSAEYRAFWAKLNNGEADVGTYHRIAKGGREVWLQASYNPIPDANGRPFKVVKYATEVTAATLAQRELQLAVQQTQQTVKCAIDGDLTHRVPMDGKAGDLEVLCRGVNSLLDSTSELIRRVKVASGEVQAGAEEISRGNTNLSQRTEEQATSLEETASSMEQMTTTVKQTADNAGQANQLAMAARQQAEKGGVVVSAAVAAMSGINEASRKIGDIIGVIDEIAFQTNLLALNAAVEAARAGEQGRGFAVVATEVRNLAGRSATAAKEIKALIKDSVVKVDEGSRLVDESGKTLEEIVTAVKKVTDIVGEIAAASREQSSGIEQVNKAVMAMDQTTQQNAALVEEAAAASQAIVEQAQSLSELISRYEVGKEAAAPRSGGVTSRRERRSKDRPWSSSPDVPHAAAPSHKAVAAGGGAEWSEF